MRLFTLIHQIDRRVRWGLIGRTGAAAYLVVLYFAWARVDPGFGNTFGLGATLYVISTIVIAILAFRPDRVSLDALVLVVAVSDAICLGLLTVATGHLEDPFYAWYVADAAVFAVISRRREKWLLPGLLVVSYLAAHLGHRVETAVLYVFLLFKVGGLLLIGSVVAAALGSQEQRRAEIESHQDEVLELYTRLEQSVAELRAVTEVTEIIHSTLDIETVGPRLLDILHKVLKIPASCIYVIDKTKQEMVFSASKGVPATSMRGLSGMEISGAMPVPADSDVAFGCIELIDHAETLVVFCADAEVIDRLSRDDRIVLQTVASELVVAVENSRLYKLTKRLAITDELTDLYNYRYLQQRLDEEIGRADRYGKRLSFLMLDIDNFKRVNDTYGHRVGDGVLAEIGQVLKTTVREVDVVARYGGEEFSVVLPETDASGAFIVAEKIREAISLTRFRDENGEREIHVTVSIGLASYPVHAHDKESLLRAADDAVYRAKGTGKNRVRAPKLRLSRVPAEETSERIAE
ncbi:MAG: GGDEF domain-containing protein [Coriobacteriia bacterium]|nr:GGDEF domain-containing protein [Coriobacteriia bacterium]